MGVGDIEVKIDMKSALKKLDYFYNRVKSINDDPEYRLKIYREILQLNASDIDAVTPVKTGALHDSMPYDEDEVSDYMGDNHYAYGKIDKDGIHWAPYHISKKYPNGFHYAEMPNIKWIGGKDIYDVIAARQDRMYKAVVDVMFDEMKEKFPLGVSKKNRYILNLGDVHSG